MLSEDDMDILGKNMGDTLYFVDGYHGGVEGHMPDGAFEDILDALERLPEWKVSFEVEPESWNDLKRKDPTGYRRLKAFIKNEKTAGRIEFVSGMDSRFAGRSTEKAIFAICGVGSKKSESIFRML